MRKLERAQRVGNKYRNPIETQVGGPGLMFKVLPQYLASVAGISREETEPRRPVGPFHTDTAVYNAQPGTGLRVTWFGHSSTLLEIDGVRILIDPVWDERASPSKWFGPKRFFAPTLPLNLLPHADVVLISHDHYDHLGQQTVQHLAQQWPDARWVCPLGVAAILHRFGVTAGRVTELDWTQSTVIHGREMGTEVTLTAVPARHFSGRSVFNRFETLWSAFVIAGKQHKVFYGADSGPWDGFAAIAGPHGPFDLTMLEIGAWSELWGDIHLGPDGAADAFAALGGGVLMPIHWGLFNLALHGWRQPMERLCELAEQRGITLFSPEPGLPAEFRGAQVLSGWWRKA